MNDREAFTEPPRALRVRPITAPMQPFQSKPRAPMRAEPLQLVEDIKQSVGLLRRHL